MREELEKEIEVAQQELLKESLRILNLYGASTCPEHHFEYIASFWNAVVLYRDSPESESAAQNVIWAALATYEAHVKSIRPSSLPMDWYQAAETLWKLNVRKEEMWRDRISQTLQDYERLSAVVEEMRRDVASIKKLLRQSRQTQIKERDRRIYPARVSGPPEGWK